VKAFSEGDYSELTCAEREREIKGHSKYNVWCVKMVEGAISETSKVWQLDMFEQKGRGSTVVLYKQTILKPFSLVSVEWP
jgi:hypothetical protein